MKISLVCSECEYREGSWSEKTLMNKIIMWNHVKREHPHLAERVMREHQALPDYLYRTVAV